MPRGGSRMGYYNNNLNLGVGVNTSFLKHRDNHNMNNNISLNNTLIMNHTTQSSMKIINGKMVANRNRRLK